MTAPAVPDNTKLFETSQRYVADAKVSCRVQTSHSPAIVDIDSSLADRARLNRTRDARDDEHNSHDPSDVCSYVEAFGEIVRRSRFWPVK